MTANHRYMSLSSLSRRPVLIAMMVYSVAYGIAIFAVWREAASTSNYPKCEKHYVVQGSAESVSRSGTRGLPIYVAARHLSI
jgi:hypothetical protein